MSYPVTGRMADSTRPELIPDKFALRPNGVLVYIDGEYKWPSSQVRRFSRHWSITTTGDVRMAEHARCIDVERFDATPQDVVRYQAAREEDGNRTVVYCDRATIPAVVAADNDWPHLLWFIATLDGRNWNPQTLSVDISQNEGIYLDARLIHAIQNVPGESYDTSLMFGDSEWAR
jgi:hypothetical protein